MTGVAGAAWPVTMLARIVLLVPIIVVTVALVPGLVMFPVLPEAPSRRIVLPVRQLRSWYTEALERLPLK